MLISVFLIGILIRDFFLLFLFFFNCEEINDFFLFFNGFLVLMLILRIFVILDIKQFYCRGLEELGVLKGIFIGVFEIVYIFVIDVLELIFLKLLFCVLIDKTFVVLDLKDDICLL